MSAPSQSYLSVNYELRPAKQVERRMIIDALHLMALKGLPIRDYQYTGFGSVYFVDFIMFHKILGIQRMLSIEYDTKIEKRVKFNKPFEFVEIAMEKSGDVIPRLSEEIRHLIWLDYDDRLKKEHLEDIRLVSSRLSKGSILLVTIDTKAPEDPNFEIYGPEYWFTYFEDQSGSFFDPSWAGKDFYEENLPEINRTLITRAIQSGISVRTQKAKFIPIFNFLYADGHMMLTLGGIIGGKKERRIVNESGLERTYYARTNFKKKPYIIDVPRVTRKERLYLDLHMPCCNDWLPEEFEMRSKDVVAYREIYRFFPAYAELLL